MRPVRDTFPLMGLAAILIANSHLERLYPKPWMAADGLLGNTLFFVLAGYGIILSQRRAPEPFGVFYWKRIVRIYPTLLIAIGLSFFVGLTQIPDSIREWFATLVWPTGFSFIANIMVFYPLLWLSARRTGHHYKHITCLSGCVWLSLLVWAYLTAGGKSVALGNLPEGLWWGYFLLATFAGGWLAALPQSSRPNSAAWIQVALIIATYLCVKFENALRLATSPEIIPTVAFAGLLQALALAAALWCVRHVALINGLLERLRLKGMAAIIGMASLQVYLFHMLVFHGVDKASIAWPVKLICFFAITVLVSHFAARLLPSRRA